MPALLGAAAACGRGTVRQHPGAAGASDEGDLRVCSQRPALHVAGRVRCDVKGLECCAKTLLARCFFWEIALPRLINPLVHREKFCDGSSTVLQFGEEGRYLVGFQEIHGFIRVPYW